MWPAAERCLRACDVQPEDDDDTLSTTLIAAFHVNPIEGGFSEDEGVRWVVVAKVILRVVHSSCFNSCTCAMARTDTARQ